MVMDRKLCIEVQKRGKFHRHICHTCRHNRSCLHWGKGYSQTDVDRRGKIKPLSGAEFNRSIKKELKRRNGANTAI